MKKLILLIIFASIMQTSVMSQQCLPDGIIFTSQTQIDSFQINFPNCTQIEGNVEIIGDNISNLNGLSTITSIGGYFHIGNDDEENPILNSLSGLENLNLVIGEMWIKYNHSLTDLSGLESLNTILGDLIIVYNDSLIDLNGLDALTSVGSYLTIGANNMLSSLFTSSSLESIGCCLNISSNNSLTSISGFENITSLGSGLSIVFNSVLPNLDGLNNLSTIGNGFQIEGNPELASLVGLSGLSSVNGVFLIMNNPSLISLEGLDNIDAGSIEDLYVTYNSSLSTCEIQSVCNYLINPIGDLHISHNAAGCDSIEEVEHMCTISNSREIIETKFEIYPNPAKNKIYISNVNDLIVDKATIFNQLGQKVLQRENITTSVDISSIEQGMYVVEIVTDNIKYRQKLIIK